MNEYTLKARAHAAASLINFKNAHYLAHELDDDVATALYEELKARLDDASISCAQTQLPYLHEELSVSPS
jgi:hypothetical protein